ncbi:MAG TPA: hypothetical protein VLA16_04540 [Ideonella sp.]|nr:hypothetical protein [Ideonella sp.]
MTPPLMRLCAIALCLLVGGALPLATRAKDKLKPPPATICAVGHQPCTGPLGSNCYAPARGESCSQGQVCGIGQIACVGRYGRSCFQPSRAESCTQGLVCAIGQSVCQRGDAAICYSPARGETCG